VIQGVRHGESRRTPVPLGLASHQAVGHGVRTTFVPQNYPLFLNLLRVVILLGLICNFDRNSLQTSPGDPAKCNYRAGPIPELGTACLVGDATYFTTSIK
jgi:hypothetical protein